MLVARERERALLREAVESEYSQFIAIYGRRRVGKTFLVREAFGYAFTFQHAGLPEGNMEDQLFAFAGSLKDAGLADFEKPGSWLEAFELLKDLIRASDAAKKVVFIDELSWMDTPRAKMLMALEGFWNGWASARRDIVLVVCASATSWMIDKVVHNKGGLYNRLTAQIHLRPFTLGECEQLVQAKGLALNRHQIIEGYMTLGGVPFYWDHLRRGLSMDQNIDALFFSDDAPLAREFDYLYASLFRHPQGHIAVVEALCRHQGGMDRKALARATGLPESGKLTKILSELESCGFVRRYHAYGKRAKGALWQLVDNFTLFHDKFLRERTSDEHFWSNQANTARRNAWCGLAFERVCMQHVVQIKAALGISGVLSDVCSWKCDANESEGVNGSQVDLLLARADQVVDICEMKYARGDYAVSKADDAALRNKVSDFMRVTGTRSAIHVVLVTTYGIRHNAYAGSVQAVVTGEDLFA